MISPILVDLANLLVETFVYYYVHVGISEIYIQKVGVFLGVVLPQGGYSAPYQCLPSCMRVAELRLLIFALSLRRNYTTINNNC